VGATQGPSCPPQHADLPWPVLIPESDKRRDRPQLPRPSAPTRMLAPAPARLMLSTQVQLLPPTSRVVCLHTAAHKAPATHQALRAHLTPSRGLGQGSGHLTWPQLPLQLHVRLHGCTCVHVCMRAHTNTHTHTQPHACTHTRTHTHTHTCAPTHKTCRPRHSPGSPCPPSTVQGSPEGQWVLHRAPGPASAAAAAQG